MRRSQRKIRAGRKTKITQRFGRDKTEDMIALINESKPQVVVNLALPYQDLTIMDACLATKTNYVDTANYEPEDTASLSTNGNGHIVNVSKKQELPLFSVAALIQALPAYLLRMP